jgi:hypothetical protein
MIETGLMPASKRCLRMLFTNSRLMLVLLALALMLQVTSVLRPQWNTYAVTTDTWDYTQGFDIREPWKKVRSPGYPVFLQTFWKEVKSWPKDIPGTRFESILKQIADTQIVLLGIALVCLGLSLSQFLPWPVSFCVIWLIQKLYPMPANYIMTEPLSLVCLLLFMACGLVVLKRRGMSKRQGCCLAAVCLLATIGYLIRPALIFLSPIAAGMLAYKLLALRAEAGRHLKIFVISAVCLGASVLYPLQLYRTEKIVTAGFLSYLTKISRALYVSQKNDAGDITDPAAREVFLNFHESKEECEQKLSQLRPNLDQTGMGTYRMERLDQYAFFCYPDAVRLAKRSPGYTPAQYRFSMTIAEPILAKHKTEVVQLITRSFLSAFGLIKGYNPSRFGRWFYPVFVLFAGLALWKGGREYRPVIVFLPSIHVLHMLAVAYGHFIIDRYASVTEWGIIPAFIMVIYALAQRAWIKFIPERGVQAKT